MKLIKTTFLFNNMSDIQYKFFVLIETDETNKKKTWQAKFSNKAFIKRLKMFMLSG